MTAITHYDREFDDFMRRARGRKARITRERFIPSPAETLRRDYDEHTERLRAQIQTERRRAA
ncbi:hypothetical protein ABIQ69_11395 [Agromyces sp. G08B096]|uniref:Uncharacterized protein n=1 Tax=Agromyces sp. G08B096 TaxID=3156399 RepID=A0AAU7W5L2_9MICO